MAMRPRWSEYKILACEPTTYSHMTEETHHGIITLMSNVQVIIDLHNKRYNVDGFQSPQFRSWASKVNFLHH